MFRTLFFRTLETLQANAQVAQELWNELEGAYSEPQRHYHTLAHLDALTKAMEPVWQQLHDAPVALLAIAYHDAVYDPTRGDNEERSADLADARTGPFLTGQQRERLRAHILATKNHLPAGDPDTDFFTDADLSILGAPAEAYDRYAAAVHAEYEMYPDALYRPGRAAVLRKFLAAGQLFKTPHFQNLLEENARRNLQRELAQLEASA